MNYITLQRRFGNFPLVDMRDVFSIFPHLVHRNVFNWIPVMGNWQLFLDIEIEDHEGLRELIREIKYQFQDVIMQVEVNEIYKTEKFSQMVIEYPELMEKEKPSSLIERARAHT